MIRRFDRLVEAVQTNCNIADARHAADLTLCTYLLEMREFYRWEQGIGLDQQPPRAAIGPWIAEREAQWQALQDCDFLPLPMDNRQYAAFDSTGVNAALAGDGLVYGAGIGRFGKPQFFLARLERLEWRNGVRILVAGCEYARNLTAAPAALLDSTIYLRRESLGRWLWGKFEAWGVKRPGGALHATLLAYGFDLDPQAALARMTDAESETLILHELGEFEAGQLLGGEWPDMCAGFTSRRAELVARALRDNLADCLVTLPTLLNRGARTSIHFWMSNFDGLRRELFPGLTHAYAAWCDGNQGPLDEAIAVGREHSRGLCERALALHLSRGADAQKAIEAIAAATTRQA
jgi:hypothetical protein